MCKTWFIDGVQCSWISSKFDILTSHKSLSQWTTLFLLISHFLKSNLILSRNHIHFYKDIVQTSPTKAYIFHFCHHCKVSTHNSSLDSKPTHSYIYSEGVRAFVMTYCVSKNPILPWSMQMHACNDVWYPKPIYNKKIYCSLPFKKNRDEVWYLTDAWGKATRGSRCFSTAKDSSL